MTDQVEAPTARALLAELQEFAALPAKVQRYIRQSLDVAFGGGDPVTRWGRNPEEADQIRTQMRVYRLLPGIRKSIPADDVAVEADLFYSPLIAVSAFDIFDGNLFTFAAYRFLYERLLGSRVRPWLASAFSGAAAMPYIHTDMQVTLLVSLIEALPTPWSATEPSFYPEWIDN
jgi:hypothetical protein